MLLAMGLLLLFLLLLLTGRWRSTSTGPQVQVPMFYDAHYLFPRPWTQEQAAPGIPDPAPLAALYGPNQVSQTFVAGADRLGMLELWLAGPAGMPVSASLILPDGTTLAGEIMLDDPVGRYYRLAFPTQPDAAGQTYTLTLAAPQAAAQRPVIARSVGGDRLGAAVRLNEYGRPGNLELRSYAQGGLPGRWWLQALGEQLLPALFRLRLQQYKPELFKGELFAGLLLATSGLTLAFLVLARPGRQPTGRAAGWSALVLLGSFLLWQLGSGRVQLSWFGDDVLLRPAAPEQATNGPPAAEPRLVHDFVLTLWTARRIPEERFIHTELVPEGDGHAPALRVPAVSAVYYPLTIPPNAHLRTGIRAAGQGTLRFRVQVGGTEIFAGEVSGGEGMTWLELPLDTFAGQGTEIALITEVVNGEPAGLWLQPQLLATAGWLLAGLPDEAFPITYHFGDGVQLVGYALEPATPQPGEPATLTLYWRAQRSQSQQATVFVHLLDAAGNVLTQHDAQPVLNSYPLTDWPAGTIVADPHPLTWPEANVAELAVGLYDPADLTRWRVTAVDGTALPDGRVLLPGEGQP